jgi:hypothetical protein
MAIVKLENVPLIPQPNDAACWFVSARMLFRWQGKTGKGSMKDPAQNEMTTGVFGRKATWYSFQNTLLAEQLNMKLQDVNLDFNGVNKVLAASGPIWTAGHKLWGGGNHGHVVVICGVADTGVFIHDPEPMNVGSTMWLTWSAIKKYVDGVTDTTCKFLTAA